MVGSSSASRFTYCIERFRFNALVSVAIPFYMEEIQVLIGKKMNANKDVVFAALESTSGEDERRPRFEQRSKKKRRTVKEEKNMASSTTIEDVFHIVVAKNFLEPKQLGQLLLFTSKRLTASAFPGQAPHREGVEETRAVINRAVWKQLCCSHWGEENADTLIEGMNPMTPEAVFRSIANIGTKDFFKLRPLQYSPGDYVVIVTVYDRNNNNKNVLCKTIPGEDIPSFFENGEAHVNFEQSIAILPSGGISTKTLVHIMRIPDQKVVQVENQSKGYHPHVSDGRVEMQEPDWEIFQSGPRMSIDYGNSLLGAHFRFWDSFRVEVEFDFRLDCTKIGVFGIDLCASFVACEESVDEDGRVAETSAITQKRVTFAHLLEGLHAFDSGA